MSLKGWHVKNITEEAVTEVGRCWHIYQRQGTDDP
jgi:hypothetical protein